MATKKKAAGLALDALTLQERVALLQLVPDAVASTTELLTIESVRDKVGVSDDELAAAGFTRARGRVVQTGEGTGEVPPVDVALTDAEADLVAAFFLRAERRGRVPTGRAFVSLFKRFADRVSAVRETITGEA